MNFKGFLCDLWHRVWSVPWSNFRFRHVERHNVGIEPEDVVTSRTAIINLAKRMFKKFKYTEDGIDQLWDAICPPPYAYSVMNSKGELRDDCDGFHSLMYHCMVRNGMEAYLLLVIAKGAGHCVLTFRFHDIWYVLDYDSLYTGYKTLHEAVESYNASFVQVYKTKSKVYYNGFLKYNYNKGKFHLAYPLRKEAKDLKEAASE